MAIAQEFSKQELQNLRVHELKLLALQVGVKTAGRKADLISRILEQPFPYQPCRAMRSHGTQGTSNQRERPRAVRSRTPAPSDAATGSGSVRDRSRPRTAAASPCTFSSHQTTSSGSSHPAAHEWATASARGLSRSEEALNVQPYNPNPTAAFSSCLCQAVPGAVTGLETISCRSCEQVLHQKCMRHDGPKEQFMCPLCRMIKMDPFLSVQRTYCLMPLDGTGTTKRLILSFPPTQLHQWRRTNMEFLVRCVKLNSPKIEHDWPHTFSIRVNNQLESIAPPSHDHKRRDTPMNITRYLKPDRNTIEIAWTDIEPPRHFALGIFICQTENVATIANAVISRSTAEEKEAKERVIQIVNRKVDDDEVECQEASHRLKLTCPVTLMRIENPVRGNRCQHLQCYDLHGFLTVTKSTRAFNNRWHCPECHLIVRPCDLVADSYVQRLIKECCSEVTVVEIQPDGTWTVIGSQLTKEESRVALPLKAETRDEEEVEPRPSKRQKLAADVFLLDSDAEDSLFRRQNPIPAAIGSSKLLPNGLSRSQPVAAIPQKVSRTNGTPLVFCPRPPADVIDLISDSEENEAGQGAATPPTPTWTGPSSSAPSGSEAERILHILKRYDFFVTPPASEHQSSDDGNYNPVGYRRRSRRASRSQHTAPVSDDRQDSTYLEAQPEDGNFDSSNGERSTASSWQFDNMHSAAVIANSSGLGVALNNVVLTRSDRVRSLHSPGIALTCSIGRLPPHPSHISCSSSNSADNNHPASNRQLSRPALAESCDSYSAQTNTCGDGSGNPIRDQTLLHPGGPDNLGKFTLQHFGHRNFDDMCREFEETQDEGVE